MDAGLKAADRVMWWWFSGTRGGPTRARIIMALKNEPMNAKQLSDLLAMNYKTVRKHLKTLGDHGFLVSFGEKYGKAYSPSSDLMANFDTFQEVRKAGTNRRPRHFSQEMKFLG